MTDDKPRAHSPQEEVGPRQEPGEPVADRLASQTIFDPLAGPEEPEAAYQPSSERVQPGQRLAGRFQVTRFLGGGGMGEVFEAQDERLGELVALKVVRSGIKNAEQERRRLRREVQLARKVTHTNVCRIYDLFEHQNPRTGATLDLVSMELLNGETLHERRRRQGQIPTDQALPIVRQIARGLNAAHKLGIVHRDLKPGNVMLEQEEGAGLRAAITDFGLAKRVGFEGPTDAALTGEGSIIGSPGYMAPEQVADEPTSPATDIFSLGLLLFEMLSGRLPFTGSSPWQIAISRLQNPPDSLSLYLPRIDPSILAVVDQCLARHPEQRFQSATEFLQKLDRGDSAWNVYGHKESDKNWVAPKPSESESEAAVTLRHPIPSPRPAKNADSSTAPRAEASATPSTAASSPDRQNRTSAITQSPDRTQEVSPESWQLPARAAIALLVLGGLVFVVLRGWGPQTHIDSASSVDEVNANEFLESTGAQALPVWSTAPTELTAEQVAQRSDALERARVHLKIYDAEPARRILETAIQALPQDPILEVHLAEVMWRLGHEKQLRPLIEQAFTASPGLSQTERLFIKALHQGFHGDWELAAETFNSLWQANPSLEVGLWVLEATFYSGRFDSRADVVQGLRALPTQEALDPRIDLWQGRISFRIGQDEEAEAMVRRVVQLAEEQGHPHLLFESLLELHLILDSLDREFESREALIDADRLARQLDQPFVLAKVMYLKGRNLNITGYEREALLELEEADALFEELGSNRGFCRTSTQHAMITRPRAEMVERLGHGLEACSQSGLGLNEAWVNHHLARVARDAGDFSRAVTLFRSSAQQMDHLGNGNGLAHSRLSLSMLLSQMGRIDQALETLSVAETWFRESPNSSGFSLHLIISASIAIRAGRLTEASAWLEEAATLEPVGRRLLDLYEIQCALAYAQGDPEALRLTAANFKQHSRLLAAPDLNEAALAYEALSLTLEGDLETSLGKIANFDPASHLGGRIALLYLQAERPERAAEASRAYSTWVQNTHHQEAAWFAEIVRIQLDDKTPRTTLSQRLRQIEVEARDGGHREIELEAALARGQLDDDEVQLAKVRDRAKADGFGRLADQAAQHLFN